MSEITIQQTNFSAPVPQFKTKPHIVFLNDKKNNIFVTIDSPEETVNFIKCKGFFVDSGSEDSYEKMESVSLLKLVSSKIESDKDSIIECSFSCFYVKRVKSLIFKQK
jgi:hypothetical protein